jgi:hypothetical protein
MEKSGKIQLTKDELTDFYNYGNIPDRVMSLWAGLTKEDISDIINAGQYEIIDQ